MTTDIWRRDEQNVYLETRAGMVLADPVVSPAYTEGIEGTSIVLVQGNFDNYTN